MSVTPVGATGASTRAPARSRRVRHQAREQLALMAFSAVTSGVLAGALLLVTALSRQA